jgi:MoaA/NifB/PqqE/SkfB family radical SAM enzyme
MLVDPAHGLRIAWHALRSRDHLLLAHLVVTRRCNLACAYCSEYDRHSMPVPLGALRSRVRELARLKTLMIACTGGEPLLHPDIGQVIREIRRCGIVAMITTNGYPLTPRLVDVLNAAGLQVLQISIDNVIPDEASSKSLALLEPKLRLLADRAVFRVNVNSVLGASEANAEDVVAVARRATSLGFSHSVGIAHDATGVSRPLSDRQRDAHRQVRRESNTFLHALNCWLFQKRLIEGSTDRWYCRAGARYLYVCEDGLVHWCSQRRGYPAVPLEEYDTAGIRKSFQTFKDCSPNCTVTCVRQVSMFDAWRRPGQRRSVRRSSGHSPVRP